MHSGGDTLPARSRSRRDMELCGEESEPAVDMDCHGRRDSASHRLPCRRPQWPERPSVVGEDSPVYQEQATFYTDQYAVYTGVIPSAQHRPLSKLARKTNHVERFNCALRQRVSRLVRATLSFSKNLSNHIGAIKYFICAYNLTKCAALPE
jgi:IS1 transposase